MILSFRNTTFGIGLKADRRVILRDISFSLNPGEIVALVGSSGVGKTTVLNLASGLLHPDEGSIQTLGVELKTATDEEISRLRASEIGIVFQGFHLLPQHNALYNILLPAYFSDHPAHQYAERAEVLLDRIGLSESAHISAVDLSEGQRQRIAIARALLTRPRLVLADEPTGNLDDHSARRVLNLLITEVRREQGTLLIATHDRRCLDLVDRILYLAKGSISLRSRSTS